MRKLSKKASAFDIINAGMISFIGFVMITVLVILLVSQTKSTQIVCGDSTLPTRMSSGTCQTCPTGFSVFNTTQNYCCNVSTTHCLTTNASAVIEYGGAAYNATKNLSTATMLPPQFAQIIVIVVIIVGILSMLAFIGYGAYQRMRR